MIATVQFARSLCLPLIFAMLTACSAVGVTAATTFNEKIAVAYGTVTQIRTTATALLKAGKIKADDAQNVQNQADHARAALDIARAMSGTDLTTAIGKLDATRVALTALAGYLSSKQ